VVVERVGGKWWVSDRPADVGGAQSQYLCAPEIPCVSGDHENALGRTPAGDFDGEPVNVRGRFVALSVLCAGVAHLVLLSSRSVVGGHPDNAVVRMHRGGEAAVRDSGICATVLRPSGFMSNTLRWRSRLQAGGVVRAPFAGVPIAAIDPYDIAAVAATVLTTAGHANRSYPLSGPVALLPADQVAILAHVLDRPLRFVAQPDDEARSEMGRTLPAEVVDAFFRFFTEGEFDDSPVVPTVENLTGMPARTFREWAVAHADEFDN
jgi:uncharacterized protein YbjT (DUF2867 family)